MKRTVMSVIAAIVLGLGVVSYSDVFVSVNLLSRAQTPPPQETKMLEVIALSKEAKLGAVTFNHVSHNKNYKIDGSGPIACTECHHTAQSAEELAKHPPLKTA